MSHEQTGDIIIFAELDEGGLVGKKRTAEEDESISDSIDELSTDYDYDEGYIGTNVIEDIRYGNYAHPYIDTKYSIFKMRDCIYF